MTLPVPGGGGGGERPHSGLLPNHLPACRPFLKARLLSSSDEKLCDSGRIKLLPTFPDGKHRGGQLASQRQACHLWSAALVKQPLIINLVGFTRARAALHL